MENHKTSIAKISRPKFSNIFQRERLFRELDISTKKTVTWIAGPAGSGKTTLIASYLDAHDVRSLWYQVDGGDSDIATFFYYLGLAAKKACPRYKKNLPLLTAEYLMDVSTFSQRYFEELYSRLTPPYTIVFDDYQEVDAASPLHEVIRGGLALAPEGITIFVLSRSGPPAAMSRLRAGDKLVVLGWNDIRFTLDESRGLVRMKERKILSDATLEHLHLQSEGWASGIVLMLEASRAGGVDLSMTTSLQASQEIFDYFANEVLNRLDSDTREFLLTASFLPKMTAQMAEKMTNQPTAAKILSLLSRSHFFIEKHHAAEPIYQFHALFHDFLISRAKETFSQENISRLQKKAAQLLMEADQIEDAAVLFRDSQDWHNLYSLILDSARSLVEQGRNKTFEAWILSIPEQERTNKPWLLYWLGISKMTADLHESRTCLSAAFELFKELKDHAGAYLSWAGVIDTFMYEWSDFSQLDYWILQIETILAKHPEFPSWEIEARVTAGLFFALMHHQPHHPDFAQWEERARRMVMEAGDIQLRAAISCHLILYYAWWSGDYPKASFMVNRMQELMRSQEISPLTRLIWHAHNAAYSWIMEDNERCFVLVEAGLKFAQSTGIHVCDFLLFVRGAFASLTSGELDLANNYLEKMTFVLQTDRKNDIALYHTHMSWRLLCQGDFSLALEHMRTAYTLMQSGGMPWAEGFILLAVVEISTELKDYETAKKCLDEAFKIVTTIKSRNLEYQYYWVAALYAFRTGNRDHALDALRRHLVLSRETGIINHFCWRSSIMAELYVQALAAGIEIEHVQNLIRKHQLVPPDTDDCMENWPWPIRIFTLGRFELLKHEKPLLFSKKTPKKPLEMLKVLIAFGGQQVSENRLCNALWPDAEGDSAHKAFGVTLIRLRELLDNKDAIRLQDGNVSLDKKLVWVDAWVFEHFIDAAGIQERTKKDFLEQQSMEKIMGCYRGPFLPDEEGLWSLSFREKVRSKFLSQVEHFGRDLEKKNQFLKAIECYQRGLDADDCIEGFYQRIMICCQKIGRRAEAISIYNRCKNALKAYDLKPNAETEAIYRDLRL